MDAKELQTTIQRAVTLLRSALEKLDGTQPSLSKDRESLIKAKVCLACNLPLGDKKVVRGCHEYCHKKIISRIRSGERTENDFISAGLLAPESPSGRKQLKNPLNDYLNTVESGVADKRKLKKPND